MDKEEEKNGSETEESTHKGKGKETAKFCEEMKKRGKTEEEI